MKPSPRRWMICLTATLSVVLGGDALAGEQAAEPVALRDSHLLGDELAFKFRPDRRVYRPGEAVRLEGSVKSMSDREVSLVGLEVVIIDLADAKQDVLASLEFSGAAHLLPGENKQTRFDETFAAPEPLTPGVYGLAVRRSGSDRSSLSGCRSFFRVTEEDIRTVYDIAVQPWGRSLNVYALDGGMSAEYIVGKAAAALDAGVAHSWEVSAPGSGPNPVYSTPGFLGMSVRRTVDFYDSVFGRDTPFDTVIVSTGFPAIPYLASSMKAPVLPLHFLVSYENLAEVSMILEAASDENIQAYATAGHDPSVTLAVAWIKLLDVPPAYLDFLERHRVKTVVILGSTGTTGGETRARRLSVGEGGRASDYRPRDIYLMYPGTSPDDEATLKEKVKDLGRYELGPFQNISDWESGIVARQVEGFAAGIYGQTNVKGVYRASSEDLIGLYNLGTFATTAFMARNAQHLPDPGSPVKGVALNPYLMGHPLHEMRAGYVPLVYWQGNPADHTVARAKRVVEAALSHDFPGVSNGGLVFRINSSRNFGSAFFAEGIRDALARQGVERVLENDYTVDEVWDPTDGMNSPSELHAQAVGDTEEDAEAFRAWCKQLSPLTIEDLAGIAERFRGFGGVEVVRVPEAGP